MAWILGPGYNNSMRKRPLFALMFVLISALTTAGFAQEADVALPPTTITASGATGEHKRFLAEIKYDYALHNDLRHNILSATAVPNNINARIVGMRGLAALNYQPTVGSMLSVYLGTALLNEMTIVSAAPVVGDSLLTIPLDSSIAYGAGAKIDFFPSWRFHLVPSFRFLRTDYVSTRGSVSNPESACSYDYSTNTASTCVAPGQTTGGGVMSTRMSQNEFLFRIEAGVDIGGEINTPIVAIYLGVEESIHTVNGQLGFSIPGAGTTAETYSFSSARTEGIYASLRSHAGPVRFQIEARGLTVTQFSGSVGIYF